MSYVIDGDLSQVIWLPEEWNGAVFGPDITKVGFGTREACVAYITEQKLDERGVAYELTSVSGSPLWQLILRLTGALAGDNPSDPEWETNLEVPINIAWRLTAEFAEIDYRKVGRFE